MGCRGGGAGVAVVPSDVGGAEARGRREHGNEALRDGRVLVRDGERVVTVSIAMGFAPFDSAESLEDVLRNADTAMYRTKRTAVNG